MWFQIPQCHYVKVSQGFSVIRLLLWDLSCNHLLMCHLNCVALQLYGVILIQFLSSLSKKLLTIWNLPSALLMFSLHLFKKKIDSVGPSLVSFMSKFLVSGTIPDSLKEATVTPLLKKSFLDTSNFNNLKSSVYYKSTGENCVQSSWTQTWPFKAAVIPKPSAISLKVWLHETNSVITNWMYIMSYLNWEKNNN